MEPPQAEVMQFKAAVSNIEERFVRKYLGGVGDKATFEEVSQGWFVTLQGSYEALYWGQTRPNTRIGTIATVRIEMPCPV